MELTAAEIEAMIYLLDDSDEEVVQTVENRIFQEGSRVIPMLESLWESNTDPLKAYRIETLLEEIQTRSLIEDTNRWIQGRDHDLKEMCLLLSRIQYPGLDARHVNNFLEKLRLDAWLKLYAATEPLDKINILNSIFYEQYGFKGNSGKYHSPDNSFLNKVIETRQGNPITLCCLYSIVAQKLGIPVFGVNLPQHFILAWCEEPGEAQIVPFAPQHRLKRSEYGKVLFYINPFSGGQLFPRKSIDEFLEKIAVSPREEFYEPCSNMDIFTRMLRNLQFSFGENSNHQKLGIIEKLMQLLPNP